VLHCAALCERLECLLSGACLEAGDALRAEVARGEGGDSTYAGTTLVEVGSEAEVVRKGTAHGCDALDVSLLEEVPMDDPRQDSHSDEADAAAECVNLQRHF
jgi:hypothetical protein